MAEEHIEMLDTHAGHTAVVGLQYGDEGKGQLVDALTSRFELVVRYNGGNNAGHSVHIGDQKFALHLIPSGILNPKAINVIGNGVVVDPEGILKEIDGLAERGVAIEDNLRISNRAHVVFNYHKLEDKLLDMAVAQARGDEHAIGTTGRGIGPCYSDKALRSTAIRMCDLVRPEILRQKLDYIIRVKNMLLAALAKSVGEAFEPLNARQVFETYDAMGKRLAPFVTDTAHLLQQARSDGKRMLFEGANAALLDIDHGTFPYVTSSNTTALGIHPGSGTPGGVVTQVFGVAKCYTSRVGGGPSPTEIEGDLADQIRAAGNEFGTTTGRPRRIGWIDLQAVKYSADLNGITGLVCTGLSVLAGLPRIKACVGYRYQGRMLTTLPADADVLEQVEPIYKEFEGFEGPIGDCEDFAELPTAAQAYIQGIEDYVGVPIVGVCVGPKRSQLLARMSANPLATA